MIHEDKKSTRLEARVSPAVHALIQQAALLQGRSLSEFVIDSARQAAEATLAEHEIIRLSLQDQERFAEALIDPAPLSSALLKAAARHRDLIEPA